MKFLERTSFKEWGEWPFLLAVALATMSASAGRAVRTFGWYRNAAQTDFQVPLALEEGVDDFTYADTEPDGTNLCVTDSEGTQLPIEIENWNPSGMSIVWVKVPSFSKDTELTLLWGSDTDELTPLRDNIWDGARLVMHLADGKDSSTFNAAFARSENATEEGGRRHGEHLRQ